MSEAALAGATGPSLAIAGRRYPVVLPTVRDPRLHLAAVIVTLQVLGQTALGFQLSIAQILVALGTCAVIEMGIALWRRGVVLWPASALLTGNGVAFILRVPGTPHGDWWSLHGAWIFAGTAAVAILSKHAVRFRGRHLFNPSNIGLVLCFLVLGPGRAAPLDFWWGPMSAWLALALAVIVAGGLVILSRLRMLAIAAAFWLAFAAAIAVLAASGHSMTARWQLGPISDWSFWWVLVSSPEILIFLFFMITDPKTVPGGRVARLVYAVAVGLVAALLIAPVTTEYWTKVAVLGALALVCAARPLLDRLLPAPGSPRDRLAACIGGGPRRSAAAVMLVVGGVAVYGAVLVAAGVPARSASARTLPPKQTRIAAGSLPPVRFVPSPGVSTRIDHGTALAMGSDLVNDLRIEAEALRLRDPRRAVLAADARRLYDLRRRIRSARPGATTVVPTYRFRRLSISLEPREGQGQPAILVTGRGTVERDSYAGSPGRLRHTAFAPFARTYEIEARKTGYVIVDSRPAL